MSDELNDTPLISVVMPVYNAAAFLTESIESILAQSYRNFEFLVVDDGSTDGSAEIIREYSFKDRRLRPLLLSHRGAGGAANAGIVEAKGKFIARMDADDIALPERFATQLDWMRCTGVDICGSCVKTFGAENRLLWFPETHAAIRNELLFRCALMQPTVMLRADIAKRHPYDERLLFEDYEMWTRLAPNYRMGNVPQVLLKYRTHPRQRHVENAGEVRGELKRYCSAYLRTLFPDVSSEDELIIARLVVNEPLESLFALERAGVLLKRLAEADDSYLRLRMAQRWRSACWASTKLGMDSYYIYRRMAFSDSDGKGAKNLPFILACLLRIQPSSRVRKILRLLRR